MKKIKQIRYYNETSAKNNPLGLTKSDLASGRAFRQYTPIIQLGVQALPGTRFSINNNTNTIVVGYTGIYELNTNIVYNIQDLSFDLQSLDLINDNDNGYLLVDIVYEE